MKLMREVDGKDKYLVLDRRGKKPSSRTFVLKSTDPGSIAGMQAYIDWHRENGTDPEYVESAQQELDVWQGELARMGPGDPAAGPNTDPLSRPEHKDILDALAAEPGTSFKVSKLA